MRFFKEHSDNIVKLFINQIGISIFAMFLYTAAAAIKSDSGPSITFKVLISVFSILFYFLLIYTIGWEIGAKDKIRIDGKRAERTPSKGILLGLWANSLNFIIVGFSALIFIIYMISGSEALNSIFAILNFIFRFTLSMYLGVIQGIFDSMPDGNTVFLLETIGFLVFSALSSVFIHFSYMMGLNDKHLVRAFKSNDSRRK